MPFVIRKIEPRYVGRGHVPQDPTAADTWPVGAELGAVSNGCLANTLKQLAGLLNIAEDIFGDLTGELTSIADRSGALRRRIDRLEDQLAAIDPKKIPVPESDICTFAQRKEHFIATRIPTTSIFSTATRPKAIQELYDAAASVAVKSLDSLRREREDAGSSMEMYLCTPVLGKKRRDKGRMDIESRVPAVLEELRRWTSTEALGDITVPPDCASRILQDQLPDDVVDHKLPSPEEQVQAVALRFPAEIVAVDVSGRGFERMSMRRRSILSSSSRSQATGENQDTSVKRRSRPRRPRGKRRNTIAGTDRKEIRQAVGEESTTAQDAETITEDTIIPTNASRAHRSASTDLLGKKETSPTEKKWHFDTLRAWGMSRLKLISPKSEEKTDKVSSTQQQKLPVDDTNVYEMVRKKRTDKSHERKPSSSSSSGKSIASSSAVSIPVPERPVKLRECAAQKRERRKGMENRDEPPHSSSGNWSASSESGRASIGSETTTNIPKSVTTTAAPSVVMSHARRLRGRDTSTSSSVTSEGTLTPDIIQDIGVIPFSDEGEGETCSVYSCDTEGYYTSFHMDSGLKTLREEETAQPQVPLVKSNETSPDSISPVVENEYELFGRGSTSTTTSSAGTVCTALLAPQPPERKSSLTVVAMVHGQNKNGGESPDSGHNTSSSPVESASSPACTARSCSELEYSESSDLEGCDRIERIRSKTAINTSRIPSMCVITPPGSDDENSKENGKKKTDETRTAVATSPTVLMSATVGTSKMEVINGQDKNLYATVQTIDPKVNVEKSKTSPLSGMLGKIRGVLPLNRKNKTEEQAVCHTDSGDYVTIADVRNNNDKSRNANQVIYSNAELLEEKRDTEYVSLSELPRKPDSSLERKRQGARVTLDSEGKVVYSSDSLKRRKGAHTTFNPGPFVKEIAATPSPAASPMFRRANSQIRSVTTKQQIDRNPTLSTTPTTSRPGKLVIRPGKSPERESKQTRGAYVNVQSEEDNALLAYSDSNASLPHYPPPYISPPKPQEWKLRQEDVAKSSDRDQQQQQQDCQIHSHGNNIGHHRVPGQHDPRHFVGRKPVFTPNQYYTLPNRKLPQGDIHTENHQIRCVTPDITRDLGKHQQHCQIINNHKNFPRNGGQVSAPVDSRNRFFAPLGLSALGYRFFASSPLEQHERAHQDVPRHPTISPITNKPAVRSNPTVAQRLSTLAGSTHTYSNPTLTTKELYSDSASIASSSGRTTPTNALLSPTRSTMSNEELFQAIHKSKRKLNIRNDGEIGNGGSLDRRYSQTGTRHSWSPESQNTPEIPKTTSPHSSTSRMDFKRLLLQQSTKIGPTRLSASEQLKLSRQQCQPRSHQQVQQPVLARALSPRSVWRFQTPRSDVLSSTIVEDAAAEERAMKLSPENQTSNGRLKTRRQLDMSPIPTISATVYSRTAPRNMDVYMDSEARRAKNLRARAEFLASGAESHYNGFRARSESPRLISTSQKAVSRSPSAPTLETAL